MKYPTIQSTLKKGNVYSIEDRRSRNGMYVVTVGSVMKTVLHSTLCLTDAKEYFQGVHK